MIKYHGISLDFVGLVVRSVVEVSNFVMESILAWVAEWISSKDMVELCERSSTLYVVLQDWFVNEILESLGDQTCIGVSGEWAKFMCGEGKSPPL